MKKGNIFQFLFYDDVEWSRVSVHISPCDCAWQSVYVHLRHNALFTLSFFPVCTSNSPMLSSITVLLTFFLTSCCWYLFPFVPGPVPLCKYGRSQRMRVWEIERYTSLVLHPQTSHPQLHPHPSPIHSIFCFLPWEKGDIGFRWCYKIVILISQNVLYSVCYSTLQNSLFLL